MTKLNFNDVTKAKVQFSAKSKLGIVGFGGVVFLIGISVCDIQIYHIQKSKASMFGLTEMHFCFNDVAFNRAHIHVIPLVLRGKMTANNATKSCRSSLRTDTMGFRSKNHR